jgi:hypothetical protein
MNRHFLSLEDNCSLYASAVDIKKPADKIAGF